MKKSILFCCYGFGIGGIEKCLLNLLNAIDTTRYDIDVLPMNPEYDLLPNLKANVNVLNPFDYVMNTTDTVTELKKQKASVLKYGKYILFRLVNKWGKKPWKLFSAPQKRYDIAIAYAHIGYVPFYIVDCVNAEKKYMWHHEGRYIINSNYQTDKEYYPKLDAIVAVSRDDKMVLVDAFPELEQKIKVLYNIIDKDEIRTKADEKTDFSVESNVLKITTVGRLTYQKGPDILLDVADKLKQRGIGFKWFWVGDGDKSDFMKDEIQKRGLSDQIVLLGNQKNPYPYINLCDIYVQPSYYEAYCTTTLEAQVLEKPIVVTDVCGMREQFDDGVDGKIVEINANSIFDAIVELLDNPDERIKISKNLNKKMKLSDGVINTYYDFFES